MDPGHRYRLLLDESMEYEVLRRLDARGHDVVHVDFVPELGKGTLDAAIARHSLDRERFVVTYDEDFITEFDERDYLATLFVPDETMSPAEVTKAIDTMSAYYPSDRVRGLVVVSREWSML